MSFTITVEVCTNCSSHSLFSLHTEKSYQQAYSDLKSCLEKQLPEAMILRNKPPKTLLLMNDQHYRDCFFDTQLKKIVVFPRIGAFEVYFNDVLIFSKLELHHFPRIDRLADYLARLAGQSMKPAMENISMAIDQDNGNSLHNNSLMSELCDEHKEKNGNEGFFHPKTKGNKKEKLRNKMFFPKMDMNRSIEEDYQTFGSTASTKNQRIARNNYITEKKDKISHNYTGNNNSVNNGCGKNNEKKNKILCNQGPFVIINKKAIGMKRFGEPFSIFQGNVRRSLSCVKERNLKEESNDLREETVNFLEKSNLLEKTTKEGVEFKEKTSKSIENSDNNNNVRENNNDIKNIIDIKRRNSFNSNNENPLQTNETPPMKKETIISNKIDSSIQFSKEKFKKYLKSLQPNKEFKTIQTKAALNNLSTIETQTQNPSLLNKSSQYSKKLIDQKESETQFSVNNFKSYLRTLHPKTIQKSRQPQEQKTETKEAKFIRHKRTFSEKGVQNSKVFKETATQNSKVFKETATQNSKVFKEEATQNSKVFKETSCQDSKDYREIGVQEILRMKEAWVQDNKSYIEMGVQDSIPRAEKGVQDSIQRAEKGVQDSIQRNEKGVQDSIHRAEKGVQDSLKREEKGVQDSIKRKEKGVQDSIMREEKGVGEEKTFKNREVGNSFREIEEKGVQNSLKEMKQMGVQGSMKEYRNLGVQNSIKELKQLGIQSSMKEFKNEEVQNSITEMKTQGVQNSRGIMINEEVQNSIKEFKQLGVQNSIKEFKQLGVQNSIKEFKQEGVQNSFKEFKQEEVQTSIPKFKNEGVQNSVKEFKQEGVQNSIVEFKQEGVQKSMLEFIQEGIQNSLIDKKQEVVQNSSEFLNKGMGIHNNIKEDPKHYTEKSIQVSSKSLNPHIETLIQTSSPKNHDNPSNTLSKPPNNSISIQVSLENINISPSYVQLRINQETQVSGNHKFIDLPNDFFKKNKTKAINQRYLKDRSPELEDHLLDNSSPKMVRSLETMSPGGCANEKFNPFLSIKDQLKNKKSFKNDSNLESPINNLEISLGDRLIKSADFRMPIFLKESRKFRRKSLFFRSQKVISSRNVLIVLNLEDLMLIEKMLGLESTHRSQEKLSITESFLKLTQEKFNQQVLLIVKEASGVKSIFAFNDARELRFKINLKKIDEVFLSDLTELNFIDFKKLKENLKKGQIKEIFYMDEDFVLGKLNDYRVPIGKSEELNKKRAHSLEDLKEIIDYKELLRGSLRNSKETGHKEFLQKSLHQNPKDYDHKKRIISKKDSIKENSINSFRVSKSYKDLLMKEIKKYDKNGDKSLQELCAMEYNEFREHMLKKEGDMKIQKKAVLVGVKEKFQRSDDRGIGWKKNFTDRKSFTGNRNEFN